MKTAPRIAVNTGRESAAAFALCVSMLVSVPLAFSTSVYRIFSLPKFAILLTVSAALAPLTAAAALRSRGEAARVFRSRHVAIVCLYFVSMTVSTILGVAPLASLFGSFYNQMGLMTHSCFIVCFFGLVFGVGQSEARLLAALRAMALTGFLVAAYALIQISGHDPFLQPDSYWSRTESGPIMRVIGTLGHADYLGNFLLYTTPLTAGLGAGSRGRARWLALVATALSAVAITCSGTRGAWAGFLVGMATFVVLEMRGGAAGLLRMPRGLILNASVACAAVLILAWAVSLSPMPRSVAVRARSLFAEGVTGAGRTLLWRDSIKMIPEFALTGAGPEGFRKAFLAYKSKELARLAPGINNESSHNSYIDAAVSYGLPGVILYVASIASSLSLLLRARRRARSKRDSAIVAGIFSSLLAVAVHNFFIFDQIPTGLYFFAFLALALVMGNVSDAQGGGPERDGGRAQPGAIPAAGKNYSTKPKPALLKKKGPRADEMAAEGNELPNSSRLRPRLARRPDSIIAAIGLVLVALAAWYVISVTRADRDIHKALAFADAGDVDHAARYGERAAHGAEPTGAYDFLFAQALATCSERMRAAPGSGGQSTAEQKRLTAAQGRVIHLAIAHAEQSAAHTLTPDSSYVLLAYLALLADDAEKLRAYAAEAVKWDPNYSDSHWLMAEAYLKEGAREQAEHEAGLALALHPSSRNAASALARATSEAEAYERTVAKTVARARRFAGAGDVEGARRLLLRAIRKSSGPCPECHRALALVYEMTNSCDEAIAEWQTFMRQDSARAAAEQVEARIEQLKQKDVRGECAGG
jgi:O-antigen ligase/tetratricopeptide (TPR) repeat protein